MATLTLTAPSSSSNSNIELQQYPQSSSSGSRPPASAIFDNTSGSPQKLGISDLENIRTDVLPPQDAVEALQRWNSPRINMWRVFATFWSFLILGMNDGSYGAHVNILNLPPFNRIFISSHNSQLETYYDLSYTVVSLIFLSPFLGYSLASICNNLIHTRFGQRGVSTIGPLCHLISYIVISVHPPYPVLVFMLIFVGFGNGLIDAAWCAWIGNMANANEVSGVLQACYSLGATIAPLIVTSLIENTRAGWWVFYHIMIGGTAIELLTSASTFWKKTGTVYQEENPRDPNAKSGRTREALKNKLTWIFALFIFGYVGAEVSLGGWIITFMTTVRSARPLIASATSTGFWAGMTVGRLFLGFLTGRIGEYRATLIYLFLAACLELIFWLVPNLFVSATTVAFLGLVMGPMFPTSIVLVTKLLPNSLHVGTIGFATAFGGSGGAIFPFIVGAIAQARGVKTLHPVILALIGAISILWVLIPRKGHQDHGKGVGLEDRELVVEGGN